MNGLASPELQPVPLICLRYDSAWKADNATGFVRIIPPQPMWPDSTSTSDYANLIRPTNMAARHNRKHITTPALNEICVEGMRLPIG
jgi:hypothetical protein